MGACGEMILNLGWELRCSRGIHAILIELTGECRGIFILLSPSIIFSQTEHQPLNVTLTMARHRQLLSLDFSIHRATTEWHLISGQMISEVTWGMLQASKLHNRRLGDALFMCF